MKKVMRSGFLCLLLLALSAPALRAADKKLSLTIKGGLGFIGSCGDMKPFFDATLLRMQTVGYTGELGYDYQGRALDLAAAADWQLAERLALRLQIGYLASNWTEELDYRYNWGVLGTTVGRSTYKLTAVPITLAPVFLVPAGKALIQIGAGPTLYFFKFNFTSTSRTSEPLRPGQKNWTWEYDTAFRSDTKVALGGQVFASGGYPIGKRIDLTIEAGYRLARVTDVYGKADWASLATWVGGSDSNGDIGREGYVWYSTSVIHGNTYHYMDFSKNVPTTSDESRRFKFDLGGPFATLGVRITL